MPQTYTNYDDAVSYLFGPPDPDVKSTPDTWPSIGHELFEKVIGRKRAAPLRPIVVTGPLMLSDIRFKRTMRFRDIVFESDVEAEAASFTRLDFAGCTFRGGLSLRNCRVAGGLSFSNCAFPPSARAPAPEADEARLTLDGTLINGRLKLTDVALDGDLSAEGVTCRTLSMNAVAIHGECRLVSLEARGDVELFGMTVDGDLVPRFLRCGGLLRMKNKCRVGGELDLAGVRIASQLDLADGAFGGVYFNGSSVGSMWIGSSGTVHCETIWAMDSEFTSYVRMSRLTVGTEALARAMGSDPWRLPAPGAAAPENAGAGAEAKPGRFAGECGTVTFRHCRFGSEVATWAQQRNRRVNGMQKDNYVAIETGLTFTDCNVAGALNLTRIRVGGREPRRGGYVRLDRTHLRGPLLISSPLAIANRLEALAGARDRARKAVARGPELRYRARMRSLSMRDLSASAVELSGLDLIRAGHDDEDRNVDGSLVAERTAISGRFSTYVRYAASGDPPGRSERARASIEGALRLRAAKVGELYLAGESFRRCSDCTAQTDGVVLELADIGLLRVPRIQSGRQGGSSAPNRNDFPVPLDLSGLTVRNWSFGEDVDPEPPVEYGDYLDFLDNDEKLHREVYKSIALSLRNSGRDEDAERILYAEEYRARWETDPRRAPGSWPPADPRQRARNPPILSFRHLLWLRRPVEGFERVFLHYRRNTINLLYAILMLFVLSATLVSSHADNFELSDSSRLILEQADGNAAQFGHGIDFALEGPLIGGHPKHWGFWNSVWLAARYHVPIVSLGAQNEYVASNDSPLRVGLPVGEGRLSFRLPFQFTAEDWFGLMSILNWVMWPLLLTFALRRALRSD